jgi:pre-mRNA-processing factor 8
MLQPEVVRRITKDHDEMSLKGFRQDKRVYLGALKYILLAAYKFLENIPIPWEQVKQAKTLYHTTRAIEFVSELPK